MYIPIPAIIIYLVLGGISAVAFCVLVDPVSPDETAATLIITVAIWPITWLIIGVLYICYRLTEKPKKKPSQKKGLK